jgi:hypothetical protein
MILVCGSIEDALIKAIVQSDHPKKPEIVRVEEKDLFDRCQFALETIGDKRNGFLTLKDRKIEICALDGVILRLRRSWWPSRDFDLQDQVFVYHETIASWFALLDGLTCPIINHFGLGWWLHDPCYPIELRILLANILRLNVSDHHRQKKGAFLFPTARELDGTQSIYQIGRRLLPAPGCSSEILSHISGCTNLMARWEQETGILFSRFDFSQQAELQLEGIEVSPLLEGETTELVDEVARTILQTLAS